MTNALLQQAKQLAQTGDLGDQSVAQKGFKKFVIPAGVTTARFIGYVEIGKQPQRAFEGKPKPDTEVVRLTFELNGTKYMRDISKEGEPEKLIPSTITVDMPLSMNEKSKFFKLMQKMKGDKDVKHMVELLGNAYVITITHNKGKGDKVYANMYTKVEGWCIRQPIQVDAISGESTPIPVPEVQGDISLLLQKTPTIEQWNSIFIDGTFKKKVGEEEIEVSKNFIQFLALGASNFEGSELEKVLTASGNLAALLSAKVVSDNAYAAGAPAKEASADKQEEKAPESIPQTITPADDTPPPTEGPGPSDEQLEETAAAGGNPLEALGLAPKG